MRPFFPAAVCAVGLAAGALAAPPAEDLRADDGPPPDLATRTTGSDWPRFLGPTGDGKSTERIRTDWPLPIRWHRPVGEGYSAPSIARGRLYFFDRRGESARLTCRRAETGEELWSSEYPSVYEDYYDYSKGPRTSPVVDGGRVYAFGVEGMLRAHRAVDGELLWEVDTTKRFGVVKNFFGVGSTPVVEGDLVIAQIGGSPPGSPKIHSGQVKGNGSGIVAFDKRTGEVRYQVTDTLASSASPALATLDGRRWGFVLSRGGLVGFEPSTGAVDFFFPWRARVLESVNAANPVVVAGTPQGDTVFITESYGPGGALVKVKPEGYEVVWQDAPRAKSLESHWATPIHHRGTLYGSSGRHGGSAELRAVELATGKVLWRQPGLYRSTLLYAGGHLVVLTEYGRLLLVKASPKRYEKVAEMDLGQGEVDEAAAKKASADAAGRPVLRFPAWNAPVLAHGLLYLRGKDRLICLDAHPGS